MPLSKLLRKEFDFISKSGLAKYVNDTELLARLRKLGGDLETEDAQLGIPEVIWQLVVEGRIGEGLYLSEVYRLAKELEGIEGDTLNASETLFRRAEIKLCFVFGLYVINSVLLKKNTDEWIAE